MPYPQLQRNPLLDEEDDPFGQEQDQQEPDDFDLAGIPDANVASPVPEPPMRPGDDAQFEGPQTDLPPLPGNGAGAASRRLQEILGRAPSVYERKKPGIWNKIGAVATGAAAGVNNANPHVRPVNASATIQNILYPGQSQREAQYGHEVGAATAAAKGEQDQAYKQAQMGELDARARAEAERAKAETARAANFPSKDEKAKTDAAKQWDAELKTITKGRESDTAHLDATDPLVDTLHAAGYQIIPNPTQQGKVVAIPPAYVKVTDDMAPFMFGRKPGDLVPWSEVTAARNNYSKQQQENAKPEKPDKPTGDYERNFLPAYAEKLGTTPDKLTADQKLAAQKEFKTLAQDPEMQAARLAAAHTEQLLKEMQLQQQPTAGQAQQVAQDIVAHRIAPEQLASMFGGFGAAGQNFKRMVYGEAKKLDPNFDFEQSSAEYGLVKSTGFQNTIRYMDSVQNSIPRVVKTANELGNGNVRFVNGLANMGKDQLNNPTLKKFRTDALLVGDEIAKILQGGGTGTGTSDAKLQQAAGLIQSSDSPQAIAAAMSEVQQLLAYRRESLTRGTYMANQPGTGGQQGGVTVALKDGRSATFPNQQAADAFKKDHADKVK